MRNTGEWCFEQDDNCHNYLIPHEKRKRFNQLLNGPEDELETFDEEFGMYRIDGISSWKFSKPVEG